MDKKELLKMEEYKFVLRLLGEFNGCIVVHSDKVARVYFDTDNELKIEYTDGTIGLLVDVDDDLIHDIIEKWAEVNPEKMKLVAIEMALGKPMPKLKHWAAKEN